MTLDWPFFHGERRDPVHNMARYYTLELTPTLFGEICLIRRWGRIGTATAGRRQGRGTSAPPAKGGQARIATFPDLVSAATAFAALRTAKLRRGYR